MTDQDHIGGAWRALAKRFAAAGLSSAELDAQLLVRQVTGRDALGLVSGERDRLSAAEAGALEALALRRLAGEPVARLRGEQEFYGLVFGLNAATLVPRPETEMLADLGLAALEGRAGPVILDLGTGSGCLPVSLLHEFNSARAIATDLSEQALEMARANALRHGVGPRLVLRSGDWFAALDEADGPFDLIVCNPPYIVGAEIATLMPEVAGHDPRLALDGGADGLDAYRKIVAGAPAHLKPGGWLMLEIGWKQKQALTLMCLKAGLYQVSCHTDLSGHDRVVVARR